MKITAKVTDSNPVHSRLSVWVDGGLIVNPGGVCLRNEEVVEFMDHLKLSSFHVKAKIREMIQTYKNDDGRDPMINLEKRIVLQVVLSWIQDHEVTG